MLLNIRHKLSFLSYNISRQKDSVYAFFTRKLQAVHLSKKAEGKLAFRYAFLLRYRAPARDRDEAGAESRCAARQEGAKRQPATEVRSTT